MNQERVQPSKRIVIVGGGSSAYQCVETIRQFDEESHIDLFTMETIVPYDRSSLHQMLKEQTTEPIYYQSMSWYEQMHIHLHLGEEVIQLNEQEQWLKTTQCAFVPYDELVLATGVHGIIPELPGNDLQEIYTLRTYEEVLMLMKRLASGRRCVVLGSGIAGIETALSLSQLHLDVSLVEELGTLLPKHLDASGSELLFHELQKQKIHVYLQQKPIAFHGINRVECVELASGKCLDTDFVICATGTRANLHLVKHTSLDYDRYLHVNPRMQTNVPHIYACGEVVSCHGIHNVQLAQKQGEVVAMNICGQHAELPCTLTPLLFQHEDFSLFQLGEIHQYDQRHTWLDEEAQQYVIYTYQEHRCCGALLINTPKQIETAWQMVQQQVSPKEKGRFL